MNNLVQEYEKEIGSKSKPVRRYANFVKKRKRKSLYDSGDSSPRNNKVSRRISWNNDDFEDLDEIYGMQNVKESSLDKPIRLGVCFICKKVVYADQDYGKDKKKKSLLEPARVWHTECMNDFL